MPSSGERQLTLGGKQDLFGQALTHSTKGRLEEQRSLAPGQGGGKKGAKKPSVTVDAEQDFFSMLSSAAGQRSRSSRNADL